VVDNLPAVPPEKYEKLTAILSKIFSGAGRIREGGLFHPQDPASKMSKGYAFVEYENAEMARAAQVGRRGRGALPLAAAGAAGFAWPPPPASGRGASSVGSGLRALP
jgi:hypothetical protein